MLIQTHRDPISACNSFNSLLYSTHRVVSEKTDPARMIAANVQLPENETHLNMAARDAHPNAVLDVYYDRITHDPIGTVQRVYDHFGLEWSKTLEEKLQSYVRKHPKGMHGEHNYDLAGLGPTDAEIERRFSAYLEKFGIKG